MQVVKKWISLIFCNFLIFFTINSNIFGAEYHIGSGQAQGGIYYDTLQALKTANVLATGDIVILYQDDKSITTAGGFPISGNDIILKSSTTEVTVSSSAANVRFFNVTNSTVSVHNIKFSSASGTSYGGAFYVSNSTLTFNNSDFIYNKANSSVGGAVYATNFSYLTFSSATFKNNEALDSAGALYLYNSTGTFLESTLFESNKASGTNSVGGAIHGLNSKLIFSSVTFSKNEAVDRGGALFLSNSNNTVLDFALFEGNKSNNVGGAIYASIANISFSSAIFNNNTAKTVGGAIYLTTSTLTFSDFASFENNKATGTNGIGGAVYGYGSNLTFSSVTFKNNEAYSNGGAMYLEKSTTIFSGGALFSSNKVLSGSGGAVYAKNGSQLFFSSSTFLNNSVSQDGGALYIDKSTAIFSGDALFSTNKALSGSGGAVYATDSYLNFSSATFQKNEGYSHGGAVYLYKSTGVFSDATFELNHSLSGTGGAAIFVQSNLFFSNATFQNNSAAYTGGALYLDDSKAEFSNSVLFEGNKATNIAGAGLRNGGALFVYNKSQVIFSSASFKNNEADSYGGAMYFDFSSGVFLESLFESNKSSGTGGAIYSKNQSKLQFSSAIFINNEASTQGGALYLSESTATFSDSALFEGNKAAAGGAIYVNNSSLEFSSATFKNNQSSGNGGAMYFNRSTATFFDSALFEGNKAAEGGAIYLFDKSQINFSSVTFRNNETLYDGGALYLNNSTGVLLESLFDSNKSYNGGAIYFNNSSLEFSIATFKNNQSSGSGGAMYLDRATATFSGSALFEANNTSLSGGAIYAKDQSKLQFSSATFKNNQASGNGGAIFVFNSEINFSSTIFRNNDSQSKGGAMYLYSSTAVFSGASLFEDNKADGPDQYGNYSGGAIYADSMMQLIFSSVTFRNNKALAAGGAMYLENSTSEFYGETLFENNIVTNNGGGAICLGYMAKLLFNSSVAFKNNEANNGGALYFGYNNSVDFLDFALFEENKANVSDYSTGGAICAGSNSQLSFSSVTFKNNETKSAGGALYLSNSTATFSGLALFEGNKSSGVAYGNRGATGGAIQVESGSYLSFVNTIFKNNEAYAGGAIATTYSYILFTGTTLFEGNKSKYFSINAAYSKGGGIALTGGELSFSDVTFKNNEADWQGGAISLGGGKGIFSGEANFENNTSVSGSGGALYVNSEGQYGSSMGSSLIFSIASFKNNKAGESGGAVYLEKSTATFSGSVLFEGNKGENGSGGAIYSKVSNFNFADVIFSHNESGSSGGAMYIDSGSNLTFGSALFSKNKATQNGGALSFEVYGKIGSTSTFKGVTEFINNEVDRSGGAISVNIVSGSNYLNFEAPTYFEGNKSTNEGGGAIYYYAMMSLTERVGDINFKDYVMFRANQSEGEGGAIALTNANSSFEGLALFAENKSVYAGGGAIYLKNSSMQFKGDKTVFDSNEGVLGGALFLSGVSESRAASLDLRNGVFVNNTSNGTGGGAIYVEGNANLKFTIDDKADDETLWAGNTGSGNPSFMYLDAKQVSAKINVAFDVLSGKTLNIQDPFSSGTGGGVINFEKTGEGVLKLGGENKILTNGSFSLNDGSLDLRNEGDLLLNTNANTKLTFESGTTFSPSILASGVSKLSAKTVIIEDGANLVIDMSQIVTVKTGKTVLKDAIETNDDNSYVPGKKSSFSYFNNLLDVYYEESETGTGKNYDLIVNLIGLNEVYGFSESLDAYRDNKNLPKKFKQLFANIYKVGSVSTDLQNEFHKLGKELEGNVLVATRGMLMENMRTMRSRVLNRIESFNTGDTKDPFVAYSSMGTMATLGYKEGFSSKVWGIYTSRKVEQKGESGYDYNPRGITFGYDCLVNDYLVGGAVQIDSGEMNSKSGVVDGKTSGMGVSLYAAYDEGKYYKNIGIEYGSGQVDENTHYNYLQTGASGKYETKYIGATGEIGYLAKDFDNENWCGQILPHIGVSYGKIYGGDFEETGDASVTRVIKQFDMSVGEIPVGVKFAQKYVIGNEIVSTLIGVIDMTYGIRVGDDMLMGEGRFVGGSESWKINGAEVGDALRLRAGIDVKMFKKYNLGFSYLSETKKDYSDQEFDVRFSWEF